MSKYTTQHHTVSPNPSLRLKGLAQASPLRLGEGSKRASGSNAGSRLGETPFAWARCSLAQKLSGSPGRPLVQTGLGESPFVSPRRDWLAWARLTGLATVSPATAMFFKPTKHTKYSHASNRRIKPYNQ